MITIICLTIAILIPVAYVVGQYNGLITLRNYIKESWADIDTELKRRYELIPNLVETVKGYAAHEKSVLESVITLRNQAAANNGSVKEQCASERKLVAGLSQLLAVVEQYPNLKANEQFLQLQKELTHTENRIQAARRFYNANVRDYTNKYESFPSNLVAQAFHFPSVDYFEIERASREPPQVNLP
ncbi:MAG: LemA family protein [Verrucomicrobiota bacterium]